MKRRLFLQFAAIFVCAQLWALNSVVTTAFALTGDPAAESYFEQVQDIDSLISLAGGDDAQDAQYCFICDVPEQEPRRQINCPERFIATPIRYPERLRGQEAQKTNDLWLKLNILLI